MKSSSAYVNARLVNARTGTHVWAEEYDRDLNEVFAIEAEVAQSVASQLGVKVSADETTAMEERTTKDLVAYDLYVHAAPLIEESLYYGLNSETNLFKAVELLNQAVAQDPTFLLAYCQLARAHDAIYWNALDHTQSRLELAKSAVDSALQLNPDSGEAQAAELARVRAARRPS